MHKTNWDKLAEEDAIHAAIAAVDEEHEKRKGEADIYLLKEKLRDGIILDLGCGYGRLAKYLLPERAFAKYIGLDSSERMLSLFQDRYNQRESERKTPLLLIQSEMSQIPLDDASVDNVIVSSVFLHNSKVHTREALSEIYRVMKPGGKLILLSNFPNAKSLLGLQGIIYLAYLRLLGKERNGPVRYFTRKEVEELLKPFQKVTIRKIGFSILPSKILIFPAVLNRPYRKFIRNPINSILRKILPKNIIRALCEWFDAICEK